MQREHISGKVSSKFDVTTGVRQGDVLAPVLFNLFLDAIIAVTLSAHPGWSTGWQQEENEEKCEH